MPRLPIKCKRCQGELGSMETPTAKDLRAMLAGSPFAAMAGMIPPNVANELASLPIFLCATCTTNLEKPNDGNVS